MEDESIDATSEARCSECGTVLSKGQDREETEGGTFCRPCFNNLNAQLEQATAAQGSDVNYSMAVVGGLAGAAIGVVVWWGFTILTNVAFGLVAVVIGFTTGKGLVMATGGKRSQGLQILSAGISTLAFFYASYLVNRTFVMRFYAEQGEQGVLPLIGDPLLMFNVISLNFGFMDVVFLAIVVYQAWRMPAPFKLAG